MKIYVDGRQQEEEHHYKLNPGQDKKVGARGFYGENNGWTYHWDVQHNIPELINLMGGNEAFIETLRSCLLNQ